MFVDFVKYLDSIIDKKTKTHIIDLIQDQYFGEISFFSDIPR